MLMMVDPNVHFHVIPRYSGTRRFDGIEFPDAGWPGPPQLGSAIALSPEHLRNMTERLRANFR
jgi:diadenosine tetraphosphate (Ap4A) HIT family hydrolase